MAKSVFISSTSKDLLEYREAVDKAIRRLELRPINMDDFGSQPGGASGVSVREVGKADVFVGIIARRYGYVPAGMNQSVTEQEYDEAVRRHIPRLMYLLDPAADWPEERIEADATAQAKLAAFRARIEQHEVRSLFSTPESLAAQVTADLTKLLDKGQREQRRARLLTTVGAALVVMVIIGLLLLGALPQGQRENLLHSVGLVPASATPTATATLTNTPTPTSTPTNTATPTNTPTITPTPLDGTPFAKAEVGVILADFKHIDSSAPNVEPNLEREFTNANIPFVRVHHQLAGRDEARAVSEVYQATIVMWGEVAKGGIQVYFEVTPRQSEIKTSIDQLQVDVTQLKSFDAYVFKGMDSLYVVDFTLGQLHYFENDPITALDYLDKAEALIPESRAEAAKASALYLYRGNTYLSLRKLDEAVADYNTAIQLDPENALLYLARGMTYSIMYKLDEALSDYDQALTLEPTGYAPYGAYLGRAYIYLLLDNIEAANADIEQAIALQPDRSDAYRAQSYAAEQRGDYQQQITALNRVLELEPDYAFAYRERGSAYRKLGDEAQAQANYAQALVYYDQAVQEQPDSPTVYIARGDAYKDMGDNPRALADYTQAIQLQPGIAFAYVNRGELQWAMGNLQDALADFDQAIRLQPDNAFIYSDRARVYFQLGQPEKAISDFSQAITLNGDLDLSYSGRAVVYVNQQQFDLALADFNEAIRLNPKSISAYYGRALIYYGFQNRNDLALADYNRLIELDPGNTTFYIDRGNVQLDMGNTDAALQDYDRALELAPDNADGFMGRGKAYNQLGEYEKAILDFDRALQFDSQNAYAYANRGIAYESLNNHEQAIHDFSQAIMLQPDTPFGYYARGIAYSRLGEYEKAIDDFDHYIGLQPDDPDGYLNRAFADTQLGKTSEAMVDYWQYVSHRETKRTTLDHFEQGKPTEIEMHTGWVYAIPLEGLAGETITASVASVEQGLVDPVVIMLNAKGEPVAYNDDLSSDNFDSIISDYALPADGIYTLIVSHAGGGSEGKVKVSLEVRHTTPEATAEATTSP